MSKNNKDRVHKQVGSVSLTWLLLILILAVSLAVSLCVFLLPERAPQVVSRADEVSVAKVASQNYDGAQTVTVIPTLSKDKEIKTSLAGTVTGSWNENQLVSGQKALRVDNTVIVPLATSTPLYRDLSVGDTGDDVVALNNELNRLGYGGIANSRVFSAQTSRAWAALERAAGNTADGSFHLAEVLWIPSQTVNVKKWNAPLGSTIDDAGAVATIAGGITKLTIKNGQASSQNRTISIFGISGTLPAGVTEVTDVQFCDQVAQSEEIQGLDEQTLAQGVDAQLSFDEPILVLRVPAGAVFDVRSENGKTVGCIIPLTGAQKNKSMKVSVVAGELGVSLLQPLQENDGDISTVTSVRLGSVLNSARCS